MNAYLDTFAARLRIELDDLATLAKQGSTTGVAQQTTYLMGLQLALILVSQTPGEREAARAMDMSNSIANAIWAAQEHLKQVLAKPITPQIKGL